MIQYAVTPGMGHSIRESDGESFEDHGSGQEMTAASGPSTPLPFSLSFATPAISFFVASVTTLSLSGKESGGKTIYYVRTYPLGGCGGWALLSLN